MSQFTRTELLWKFDGQHPATTFVADEGGVTGQSFHIDTIRITIERGHGEFEIRLFAPEGIWGGMASRLHGKLKGIALVGDFSEFIDFRSECNLVTARLRFERQRNQKFLATAWRKFMTVMNCLKATGRESWPYPDIPIRILCQEGDRVVTEGELMARLYYPQAHIGIV